MIKRIEPKDYLYVLKLNEENIDVLIPTDREELEYLAENAVLFHVIYVDESPAGFIIALREGLKDYDFKSYRWFKERYSKFLYIDRIVVDKEYWKKGIGRKLYQYAFDYAKGNDIEIVGAAITTVPYNKESLAFHAKMGFTEVGEQLIRGGNVRISQQVKELRIVKG
ncbi:GNAT family N-acetyltransferase [Butyrivibrio sp. WCE2006]|uniref:GNAT family N-acetyltransferase n=1 Tax=Butyrivibrio sp. WCE2006 TaxID=1410611 RepID=UPI0005D2B2B3|nr:GNAT family N-acetyltransferase [Butyrivibrio sp. WCE2006]